MPYSEAQKRATQKFIKENRDRLELLLPKGKKEEYRTFAATKGKSLNAYIIDLIEKDMNSEN